jgi:alpha-amylase/alpha-mannosidase (GH57 family)
MPINSFSIHGHFYQPPREDPLTGLIPKEAGAAPYDNWNERILAECYQPNARLKNFSKISFNVGPTLFTWLESQDQKTYQQIIAQDRYNLQRHGVGNALAQAYNHTILPLASSPDKNIQIRWGIADFTHRFGHPPQGMWLPETAVDYETLAIMSNLGVEFTILAPWQAEDDELDPTEPYQVLLPGGKSITVFFYQKELSARISFDPQATANADQFVEGELVSSMHAQKVKSGEDQFILLASDGELYGHHQPFRERFLAHLLDGASAATGLTCSYPALWLKSHPPSKTIRIREGTSWSCQHGVTRWAGECACSPLDARWKSPLRSSLDRLATALDGIYFDTAYPLIPKPRVLREQYIHVMLGEITAGQLISEMAGHSLTDEQIQRIYLLLESQRERQRIFTSCGWFFEDFDRIEPKNVIAYAAQAVRLVKLATGEDLSTQTISDLKHVISPSTGLTADQVFNQHLSRSWEPNEHPSGSVSDSNSPGQ